MSPRILLLPALVACLAIAADKKPPKGDAANDSVAVECTILEAAQLQQLLGSDFGGLYVVVETTLTPQAAKPLDIHLDDFLMRSEQTGEHTGPLVASQIAGSSSLVVTPTGVGGGAVGAQNTGGYGGFGGIMMGSGGGMGTVQGNKSEVKTSAKKDPMLDVLKRKILTEKTTTEPVTGLLFFPMEKEKIKHLVLIYTAKQDKLRIRFK